MRHGIDRKHVDVRGQSIVDAAPECFSGQRLSHVEMGDLSQRVHAGVGSARSHEFEILLAHRLADGAFELALHGARVLLFLPAAVARAGVLDRELVSRHSPL